MRRYIGHCIYTYSVIIAYLYITPCQTLTRTRTGVLPTYYPPLARTAMRSTGSTGSTAAWESGAVTIRVAAYEGEG